LSGKAVVIHGHFYQPPRENAWTETLERQPSAAPEHDWNERVAQECYAPNGAASVLDGAGKIVELVNNYARISFNFGPTLLSWLKEARREDYVRILEADLESKNALAQGYNHAILPLCNDRDLLTQIRWGLADFEFRFKRKADGLWLPETAVDERVLSALAARGLKFVVLAPGQAAEAVDCEPYLWSDGENSLALFFYDGGLSHGLAFGRYLSDAPSCAEKIAAIPGSLTTAATDGESYGHHGTFMEMGLAHLLTRDLPRKGIEITTFTKWLAKHPARRPMKLKPGGTAWSCAHGLGRWSDDCGCGTEGGHGKWRRPLRAAFDWLRDELAPVFEKGPFHDPWKARDEYIEVVLDRERTAPFLRRHLKPGADKVRALELLEMQRYALLMYTSCAWFFDDVSRIEAVQNLQYAARAIELSGKPLEKGFLERLALAPSNNNDFPTAADVYARLALAGRVDDNLVAAHYAAAKLAGLSRNWSLGRFKKTLTGFQDSVTGRTFRVGAKAWLENGVTIKAGGKIYGLRDLLPDAQAAIMEKLPAKEALAILEQSKALGLRPSPSLLSHACAELEKRLLKESDAVELRHALERAKRAGVAVPNGACERKWVGKLETAGLPELLPIVELLQEAGYRHWHFKMTRRVYEKLKAGETRHRAELIKLAKALGLAV
jgi:alpha-amylase/alpha-mannosidase (GH57 family)